LGVVVPPSSHRCHTHRKAKGKLAPKFYAPFKVLEHIGALAYRLELSPQSRIHNVFHVVFLKKFNGAPSATPTTLPPIKHGRILPEPEKALHARLNRGVWKIMVKWAGQAAANATWEQVSEFKEAFPSFQLEDELFHNWGGGRSVVDAFIGKQYQRRPKQAVAAHMAHIRSN
jgi:hypothetical protein